MRMIACVVKHMLGGTCWTLFSQEVCNEAAQQEAVCAAYNVRSSSCAFMDEALLWHADCAGASFQQLCCSCSSDAAESLRLYSAFNVPLLSPPALHRAIVLGGALPMTDSRSAYTKVSLCFLAWLCLAGDTGDISQLSGKAINIGLPHLSKVPSSEEHVPPSEPVLPS